MSLIESLKWRYAVKKYSNKKVSEEDLASVLEAINLSASSIGLQPYRLVLVEDKALKEQLGEGSFNAQISEASHLIVFAAYKKLTQELIDDYLNHMAEVRKIPVAGLEDFRRTISGYLLSQSDEENFRWASRQAYIALGTGLIAAADRKIDATPMEGFDSDKFDELLGLKERDLKSVVIMAIGYRDEEADVLGKMAKVRLPIEELVIEPPVQHV